MSSTDKTCMYCKRELGLLEAYYKVREAKKPKYTPNRFVNVGICCESCEQEGKPTCIEFKEVSHG